LGNIRDGCKRVHKTRQNIRKYVILKASCESRRQEGDKNMKYRVISIIGNQRTVMAEVISEAWPKTFAEDIKKWVAENGGHSLVEIVVEEI
jgi:hypothetical protein